MHLEIKCDTFTLRKYHKIAMSLPESTVALSWNGIRPRQISWKKGGDEDGTSIRIKQYL